MTKLLFFFIFLFVQQDLFSNDVNNPLLMGKEILLSDYQINYINEDLPVRDLAINGNDGVWLLGKKNLWYWKTSIKNLRKIPVLDKQSNEKLMAMTADKSDLIVLSNENLYRVQFQPFKILRLPKNIWPKSPVRGLFGIEGKEKFVYGDDFIIQVMELKGSLEPLLTRFKGKIENPVAIYDQENEVAIIFSSGNHLIKFNALNRSTEQIRTMKNPVIGMTWNDGALIMLNRYSVASINAEGKLIQNIPIAGNRRLVASAIADQRHAYLFSDKLLEVYDMQKEKKHSYFINLGKVRQANKLHIWKNRVALITDYLPRLFVLPTPQYN